MNQYLMTDDDVVEILHNKLLKNRPYLLRFTNYDNERYEIRMSEEDITYFIKVLKEFRRDND